MIRIVESEEMVGLVALLGERVLLLCMNYFYEGKLVSVNETCVELKDPSIVYETGEWSDKKYKDTQKFQFDRIFVQRCAIEAFGVSK